MVFSSSTSDGLRIALVACSAISSMASFILIITYFLFPKVQSRSAKLVIWLSLTDLSLCLSVLIYLILPQKYITPFASEVFAAIANFEALATVFWACTITKTMALVILKRDQLLSMLSSQSVSPKKLAIKRMFRFHVMVWSAALSLTLIPALTGSFRSYKYSWYWFKTDTQSQYIAVACYYLPILIGVSYNSYVLLSLGRIKYYFGLQTGDQLGAELYTLAMTLKNYPIVTAVVSTVSLMLQLTRWLTHHNESSRTYWLHTTLAVLQLSQGIANFVIFFYSIHRNRDRRSQVDTVKRVHLFTPVNADDSTASGSSQPALENSGRRSEMDNSMRGDDFNDDPAYIVDAVISSLCWPCIKWGFFSSPSGHSRDSVALQGSAWRYRPVVDVSATAGEDSEQCVSFVFDNSFGFGSSSTGIGEGLLSAHQKPPSVDSTGARSVSRESA